MLPHILFNLPQVDNDIKKHQLSSFIPSFLSLSFISLSYSSNFFSEPLIVGTLLVALQSLHFSTHRLILSSLASSVLIFQHIWHCTYSFIYFLTIFSIGFWRMPILTTSPFLPIHPYLPSSIRKKFMTCSGCLSNCLQMSMKLTMVVWAYLFLTHWGGLSTIFDLLLSSGFC